MSDFKKFFKLDGNSVKFTGQYMEVYLPKIYFDKEIAVLLANKVETLGLFVFKIFNNIGSEVGAYHTYKFPSKILMSPAEIEYKTMEIKNISDEYTILKFYNNDNFMENINVTIAGTNSGIFMQLITSGKLPATIPYNEILPLIMKNFEINKFNPNVPSIILEIIIAELNRDPNNLARPFRYIAENPKSDMYSAYRVDIKTVSQVTSAFTAVTFENFDYSVVTAINKSINGVKEIESPVEKTIKF